ncbi:MAG: T9SS type B sorting domain-containing protein [Cytophagales bacterium]|nr:T9SS type B sorting domain-containing protein [Cytophagales bacterium]
MKKLIIYSVYIKVLLVLILSNGVKSSIAQQVFQKTYGGISEDTSYSIYQTADGGYIFTGTTNSFGAGGNDVLLIKTDSLGDTLWTKAYGGTGNDHGRSVMQTTDLGYIITGYTNSFGAGEYDVYLIKTDSNGNTQWTKTYGGAVYDAGSSVIQTTDGSYIITGVTESFGAGGADLYFIKADANGNTMWAKTFGGSAADHGNSIQQTNDNGYIIAGKTESFGAGGADVYLIRTNADGDTLWTRSFGGSTGDEEGYEVHQTGDGGYIISGYTSSFGAGNDDIYLIKADPVGNLSWSKTYGGAEFEYGLSVVQNNSGGYVVTGNFNSFGATTVDVYLLRTDPAGNMIGNMKSFGSGSGDDFSSSIKQTADGGYIIAGYSQSFGAGGFDVFLIKADSTGGSDVGGCGGGAVVPIVNAPATVVNSTATQIGSGGTINSAATIVNNTASVIGTLPLGLILTIDNHVSCNGGADGLATASVSGGTPPYNYLWAPGNISIDTIATSNTQDSLPAGPYTVTVFDAFGCFAEINFTIYEPDPLILTTTSNLSCTGGIATVSLTGGTLPYDYSWTTGDITLASTDTFNTISGLAIGTHSVTITDANGCTTSDSIIFTGPGALDVSADTGSAICGQNDGLAWAVISGGAGPYTYLWDDSLGQTTDTAFNLYAGFYTVIVADSNGCVDSAYAIVNNLLAPVIKLDSTSNISCNGDNSGDIYISVSGGTLPYAYLWSDSQTTEDINTLTAGSYTLAITDGNGCKSFINVILTEPPSIGLTVTVNSNVSCNGGTDGMVTASITAGPSPYDYVWSTGNSTLGTNATSDAVTNLSADTIWVTITDASGCSEVDSVTITEPGALVLDVDSSNISCKDSSDGQIYITVKNGAPPYTYLWNDPGNQTDSTATGLPAGTYTVVVTDSNGCTDSAIVTITQPVSFIVLTTDSTPSFAGNNDGSAWVSVTGGTGPYSYLWDDSTGQKTDTAFNLYAGIYTIIVTDANGCVDSAEVIVDSITAIKLTFYSGISPNLDDVNDSWYIIGIDSFPNNNVTIYNRYGHLVWGEKNYDNKDVFWKGTNRRGRRIPDGTYFFLIEITNTTGRQIEVTKNGKPEPVIYEGEKVIINGWVEIMR